MNTTVNSDELELDLINEEVELVREQIYLDSVYQ